jgi:hypothetical protein
MAGVRTDDPRFVNPEDLPERPTMSRKRWEERQREEQFNTAKGSMRAWLDEDI